MRLCLLCGVLLLMDIRCLTEIMSPIAILILFSLCQSLIKVIKLIYMCVAECRVKLEGNDNPLR